VRTLLGLVMSGIRLGHGDWAGGFLLVLILLGLCLMLWLWRILAHQDFGSTVGAWLVKCGG
jgi:hypothetical protein